MIILHTFIGGSVCVVSLHVALSSSKQQCITSVGLGLK